MRMKMFNNEVAVAMQFPNKNKMLYAELGIRESYFVLSASNVRKNDYHPLQ